MDPLEKAMATHSSTLAWKIPWTEESGRLQSMGWLGVGHNWATSLSLFTFMHWRRKWQPTPVFLPGESQGRGSLVGCCLQSTESDTTEATQQQQQQCGPILGFPGGSVVKNAPANSGDTGSIPGSGRFPEKEMATHFSILAWGIPWTEDFSGLQSMGLQKSQTWLSE